MNWLSYLSGWRTYLASWAKILSAVSAFVAFVVTTYGGMDFTNGATLTAVLIVVGAVSDGLSRIFQRAATATTANDVTALLTDGQAEFKAELQSLRDLIAKLEAKPQPALPIDPFAAIPNRIESGVQAANIIRGMLIAILLGAGSVATAAPPTAIINGPRTAEAGEEVIFDASKSEGAPTVYAWRVYPKLEGRKQLTVLEGGSQVRLASFPGRYLVRVMVANADGISDQELVITIPGTAPCPPSPEPVPPPPPGPVPTPTPTPVVPVPVVPVPTPTPVPTPPIPVPDLPPGEFDGLPAAIKALALTVVSSTRSTEAQKLADSFEALAAQIAAGAVKTPIAIVAAVGGAFNSSVTAAWDAQFRPAAVARMKALYDAGKLATPERWRAMLLEAATGLRAVK